MSLKFRKCQRKTPVLESLCNKVRPATLSKKDSNAIVLFCNFKNGYFEEHLQSTDNAFCYFFQASEEGKSDNDHELKIF